ncbi:MAG TPA: ATP-binding protein [Clostridia bacterium]|nr:ATP-binding protein [Clostridia bacterium]HQM39093.1 ATP-binding protein [Clostridia bacterium]
MFSDYLKSINVREDHIIKVRLDELKNATLRNPILLSSYINERIINDGEKYYILLDEIQECVKITNPDILDNEGNLIEGISEDESYLIYHDVLNELLNIEYVDCYITGSNSRLLSSDLPTEFRNRNYNIEVFPLSYKELKQAFPDKQYDELWDEYISYGGMPLAVLDRNVQSKQNYFIDLFDGTYFKDIKERYGLRDEASIDTVTDIIASCISSPLNPGKIEKTFKSKKISNITDNTISNYLKYLENSFLIKEAKRYDVKGRKYIGTLSKYYFIDIGLRNARLNFRQIEESHIMESIIYIELIRNGYSVDVGQVESWIQDHETKKSRRVNYEVDFIVNDGNKKYYIQSAFELSSIEKVKQEQKSLMKIGDNFRKIIIVKGFKNPQYNDDGILIIGLYNFLMNVKIIEQ